MRKTQDWTLAIKSLGIGRSQMLWLVRFYAVEKREWQNNDYEREVKRVDGMEANKEVNTDGLAPIEAIAGKHAPETWQRKTNLEIAREKLPKEELIQLKEQGFSDNKILRKFNIHPGTFYKLKKEYGLISVTVNAKPEEAPAGTCITLAQALEMQKELQDDIRCLELIVPVPPLSAGVSKLLIEHGVKCRQRLDDLQKAFENTKIRI